MSLEKIVRPYETPAGVSPQMAIASGQAQTNAPIRVRFGENQKGKAFTQSYSSSTTFYVKRKPKEELG